MTDARFPERWLMDGRLQSVSAEAYRTFCNALMWAVSNRTEGHLPGWAVALIPHATDADAGELARCGLWLDDPRGGWTIDRYADDQSTVDELDALAARRRADRARKAAERARKAEERTRLAEDSHVNGHVTVTRTAQARTGQDRPGQGQAGSGDGQPTGCT